MIYKPRLCQERATHFMLTHDRSALWMGMGLGKTSSSLTAVATRLALDGEHKTLVLGPKRVIRDVWPFETKKWDSLQHLDVTAIDGSAATRARLLHSPAPIHAVGYDNVPWLLEQLGGAWPYDAVICDESSRVKAHDSIRFDGVAVRRKIFDTEAQLEAALAKARHPSYRPKTRDGRFEMVTQARRGLRHILAKTKYWTNLTGTPAPNGLQDQWAQTYLLDRGARLGRTITDFRSRWFREGRNGFGYEPLSHAQAEIGAALSDICLTLKAADYLDLPPLIENVISVQLPDTAKELHARMKADFVMELRSGTITAANAADKSNKMLQLASGFCYLSPDKDWEEVHTAKLEALESVMEEAAGEPVIVTYQFQADLTRLRAAFPDARMLKTKADEDDWNAGRIQMLLLHPACLHPSTEVLTETRGWLPITQVWRHERVFDGVEFVKHKGCSYSGVSSVMDVFGIRMTSNHMLLIGGDWIEAKHVGDSGDIREAARYSYAGDDKYLIEMLTLRPRRSDPAAEREEAQSAETEVLFRVCEGNLSQPHGYRNLELVARDKNKNEGQTRQRLWGPRGNDVPGVGGLPRFLRRYARWLLAWFDDRAAGRERPVLESELHLGDQSRTASQQTVHPQTRVPRGAAPSRGNMPEDTGRSVRPDSEVKQGYGRRGSAGEYPGVEVRPREKRDERSPVFDLVDCGPRSRFLIRNRSGEVFVSHNSAGHGLNLQYGGRIMADFSLGWNLEYDQQVIERIGPTRQFQAGLNRPTIRHRLVADGTIDQYVLAVLQGKATTQDAIMEFARS